ncbi:MAG: hypothetical protein ACR2K2_04980 [Mycobacteriales bacterium]
MSAARCHRGVVLLPELGAGDGPVEPVGKLALAELDVRRSSSHQACDRPFPALSGATSAGQR